MQQCRYNEPERLGLYIMVFIIMLNTCNSPSRNQIEKIVKEQVKENCVMLESSDELEDDYDEDLPTAIVLNKLRPSRFR